MKKFIIVLILLVLVAGGACGIYFLFDTYATEAEVGVGGQGKPSETKETCTVTYVDNGAEILTQTYLQGETLTNIPEIENGQINFGDTFFAGWATDDGIFADKNFIVQESVTLYSVYDIASSGLYEEGTTNLISSWDELVRRGRIEVVQQNSSYAISRVSTSLEGSLYVDDTITGISPNAFEGCSLLIDITIPETVTYINRNAFKDCTGLTSIYIPESVESFGVGGTSSVPEWSLFDGCSSDLIICCGATEQQSGWFNEWNNLSSDTKATTYYDYSYDGFTIGREANFAECTATYTYNNNSTLLTKTYTAGQRIEIVGLIGVMQWSCDSPGLIESGSEQLIASDITLTPVMMTSDEMEFNSVDYVDLIGGTVYYATGNDYREGIVVYYDDGTYWFVNTSGHYEYLMYAEGSIVILYPDSDGSLGTVRYEDRIYSGDIIIDIGTKTVATFDKNISGEFLICYDMTVVYLDEGAFVYDPVNKTDTKIVNSTSYDMLVYGDFDSMTAKHGSVRIYESSTLDDLSYSYYVYDVETKDTSFWFYTDEGEDAPVTGH